MSLDKNFGFTSHKIDYRPTTRAAGGSVALIDTAIREIREFCM